MYRHINQAKQKGFTPPIPGQRTPYSQHPYVAQNGAIHQYDDEIQRIFDMPEELSTIILGNLLPPVIHQLRSCGWKKARVESLDNTSWVPSLSYRPDGRYIASGSHKTIKIWDAATGELVHALNSHTGTVASLSYSPDGKYIASGSNRTIKIWNAETGVELHSLDGHTDFVISLSYSPDGGYIASGSGDRTIKIWNTATGDLVRTLSDHTREVTSLSYSPDGRYIASGSGDRTIKMWNTTTGDLVRTLNGHTREVTSLSYSPDGRYIASGSADSTIKIWNAATENLVRTLNGHTATVTSLSYSPDGAYIASGSGNGVLIVWSSASLNMITTLTGNRGVTFSPNGNAIASGILKNVVISNNPFNNRLDSILARPHQLTPHQLVLLYALYKRHAPGTPGMLPDFPNVIQSYLTLPEDLRNLVRDCFRIIPPMPTTMNVARKHFPPRQSPTNPPFHIFI